MDAVRRPRINAAGNGLQVSEWSRNDFNQRGWNFIPDWALYGFAASGGDIIGITNRFMSPQQAQQVVEGNLTRVEAAVWINEIVSLGIMTTPWGAYVSERQNLVNSQAWQTQVANRFWSCTTTV